MRKLDVPQRINKPEFKYWIESQNPSWVDRIFPSVRLRASNLLPKSVGESQKFQQDKFWARMASLQLL